MYSVKWSQYCRASRNNQKHGKIRYKKRPGSQEKAVNMFGLQEFQVEGGVWM
jgi:phage terminase small subunit